MLMRYVSSGWLCSLIVCCTGAAAAQSLSDNASAVADGSAGSSVSASVNASVNASVGEAALSSSGSRLGGSALRSESTDTFAIRSSRADWRASLENQHLIYRAAGSKSRTTPGARKSEGPNLRSSGGETAAYSEGFADSTKGTALISPPDPGTASPLDWNLGLNFGFPDFQQMQFLNPNLHNSTPRKGSRVGGRKAATRHILNEPALSTSIDEQLGFKAPSAEQDILGQGLPSTSIDEQLGLH